MKALTVQQPWAWAIMHGGKLIENRTQNWNYRGPLAIHAGLRFSRLGGDDLRIHDAWHEHGDFRHTPDDSSAFTLGAIIGTVDLVDVHPDAAHRRHPDTVCCPPWGDTGVAGGCDRRRITHLVLENPQPLAEPIPAKGALGLWTPTDDVLEQLCTHHELPW